MEESTQIIEKEDVKTSDNLPTTTKVYPMVEELTFRAIVKSEAEAYKLLTAIQIFVNELGTDAIIDVIETIKAKPSLLQKAKSYLPYLKLF